MNNEDDEANIVNYLDSEKNTDICERKLILDDKKNIATAIWPMNTELIELIKMRGNFWKSTGFAIHARNFMYPEEALYLTERYQLYVERDGNYFPFDSMYEQALKWIPLQCYLTYVKLKSLDYIVFRHRDTLTCVSDEAEILQLLLKNPSKSLLDCLVSFDIYPHSSNFSKKHRRDQNPLAFVVIFDGSMIPSARIMITLLEEARGTPILLSLCSSSGSVLLEEFSDALTALNWKNALAISEL